MSYGGAPTPPEHLLCPMLDATSLAAVRLSIELALATVRGKIEAPREKIQFVVIAIGEWDRHIGAHLDDIEG